MPPSRCARRCAEAPWRNGAPRPQGAAGARKPEVSQQISGSFPLEPDSGAFHSCENRDEPQGWCMRFRIPQGRDEPGAEARFSRLERVRISLRGVSQCGGKRG